MSARVSLLIVLFVASVSVVSGHPHGPDTTVVVTGTLTNVDVDQATIAVDTIDRKTLVARNMLLFVDPKAKLRQGKRKLGLADLQRGQRVTCVAEREEDKGDRLVAIDIRLLDKPTH